ncbi:MAG: TonB-dependent receptor [Xanthomonadales bacterium]|nr:TonB-dependent receptor [Xanthomonadales bacterium]
MRHLNRRKLSAAVLTALYATTAPVAAQGVADDGEIVEEIVVTGSRIARPDLVANSPVAVIDAEEFELAATVETESLLNTLPQVVPSFGATTNNPGTGTATVDLRNLGTVRTLVMMNGRRIVGSNTNGVVDINNIPPALIERVEVATGGASAVYGSDAMAGVVNFILKEDYEGIGISGQFGTSAEGDSDRTNVDFIWGSNSADGRGNAVIYANYYERDQTFASERGFSAIELDEDTDDNGNPILSPGGSSRIPQGRFSGSAFTGLTDVNGDTIGGSGFFVDANGNPDDYTSPDDTFNFAPFNNLQLPLERWTTTALGSYELAEQISAFGEFTFANNRINRTLAPTPYNESGVQIDLNNPFIPAGTLALFQQADVDGDGFINAGISRRMLEAGGRISEDSRNMWRAVIGVEGEIGGWDWEAFYNYGRMENTQRQDGNIVLSKFQEGLLVNPANPNQCASGNSACVVINPFGEGNMTPEMIDWVRASATNITNVEQRTLGANMAGTLMELPAGPLGFAAGLEQRDEEAQFLPDTFLASGDVDGFNAGLPTAGEYDVTEVFFEAIIPLLSGAPLAEYVALEVGYRYSDYSNVGGVDTYKFGGEWQPTDQLKLRGLFQRAVRAPNVLELFRGSSNSFPGATDFCNAGPDRTAEEEAFCVQLGVPENLLATFQQPDDQIEVILSGNPNLDVESSDTWSLGFVYEPEALPNLQVSADYYSIEIEGAIATFGGGLQSTIDACGTDLSLSNVFCQPLTARNSAGELEFVPLPNQNIAQLATEGIDLAAKYATDIGDNQLSLTMAATYVFKNEQQSSPVTDLVDCVGSVGVRGTCGNADPEWRVVGRATLTTGKLRSSLRYRYVGEVANELIELGTDPSTLAVTEVDGEHYLDLGFTYNWSEDIDLILNVDNLLDTEPPILADAGGQFNTDASVYDVLGRRFTTGFRVRF